MIHNICAGILTTNATGVIENINPAIEQIFGSYREVTGLHRNGNNFPLEINISEMLLDGKKYFTCMMRDISERKEAEARLTRLALYDQLTGLPNRTLFFERLEFSLSQARRAKSMLALLFIDLDSFKEVNDTLEHDMGDRLLKEVGKRLSDNIRKSDVAARMGDDESPSS